MKIAIRVKPVMVFFIYVPILLTLLSLVGQYSKYFLGNQNPLALVALFDVCGEENISSMGLINMARGVKRDYFLLKRDLLTLTRSGDLKFGGKGFRGTGDFAEHITKGDQVVDLEGNLIDVAYEANVVRRIDALNGWSPVPVSQLSMDELVKEVRGVIAGRDS